jgi:hypothetical protein
MSFSQNHARIDPTMAYGTDLWRGQLPIDGKPIRKLIVAVAGANSEGKVALAMAVPPMRLSPGLPARRLTRHPRLATADWDTFGW